LIAINSSPDDWIIDLGASDHMDALESIYSSFYACKGPTILMGDNSSVEVTGKGRIELNNGSFENSDIGNKFIFTPNSVDIYNMQANSKVIICKIPDI
jgi:hypothetical protein